MAAYDFDGTTTRKLSPLADFDGSTTRFLASGYDFDGTTARLVYQKRKYLVQNGVALTSWGQGGVQGSSAAFGWSIGQFGLLNVGGSTGGGNADVVSLASLEKVDFTGCATITFVFTKWARDNSASGYYRTCAGVFSNRTAGIGGDAGVAAKPASLLAGWGCNEAGVGSYTRSLAGISSGYLGLSTGGGYAGVGSILVSDIYIE